MTVICRQQICQPSEHIRRSDRRRRERDFRASRRSAPARPSMPAFSPISTSVSSRSPVMMQSFGRQLQQVEDRLDRVGRGLADNRLDRRRRCRPRWPRSSPPRRADRRRARGSSGRRSWRRSARRPGSRRTRSAACRSEKVRSKLAMTASTCGESTTAKPASVSSSLSGSSPTTKSRAPGIRRCRKFAMTSDEWMMSLRRDREPQAVQPVDVMRRGCASGCSRGRRRGSRGSRNVGDGLAHRRQQAVAQVGGAVEVEDVAAVEAIRAGLECRGFRNVVSWSALSVDRMESISCTR